MNIEKNSKIPVDIDLLYQVNYLLQLYKFKADKILNEQNSNLNAMLDSKCYWALRNIGNFPVEVNNAGYYALLRVPGINVTSAKQIITARREHRLNFDTLKKLGVVLEKACYFITCGGEYYDKLNYSNQSFILDNLDYYQTSLFDKPTTTQNS